MFGPSTIARISDPSIRNLVVYGGSKSALDAVYMLLRAGKTVDWVKDLRAQLIVISFWRLVAYLL